MTRQRQRRDSRLLLDQIIQEHIAPAVESIGSSYIEVQDHDNIHGVLVQVEVKPGIPSQTVNQANQVVRGLLRQLAQENADKRLAAWTACFSREGKTLASSWPEGAQDQEDK